MAPQPLPTNAQRNRGLGSGSTAGILAAIPQSTTARSHPDRTAQACAPGPQFAWASCLGGRGGGGGVRHPGLATQKVWAGQSPFRNGLGGWPLSQVRRCPQKEAGALCVSTACVCLKTWPAQEPAGSCSHLKGPGSLSKASVPGSSPLPFCCWPERWTGCHCSLKRVKGECLGNIRFVRQATVSVFCVFMPQFASALATVATQCCCLLADASPHPILLFVGQTGREGLPSSPVQPPPRPPPAATLPPLGESSLLL